MRSFEVFQHYIDDKLEKYNSILLEQIDKKFFYLTNKDQYLTMQKDEISKLINRINPSDNNLQNYQTLFKLNEFLANSPDMATKIKNEFASFLNLSSNTK
jgi:hypothetical protein